MAITLRIDEGQDAKLEAFMVASGHKTKNKALIWLIENSARLVQSDEKLNAIIDAQERRTSADEMLSKLCRR